MGEIVESGNGMEEAALSEGWKGGGEWKEGVALPLSTTCSFSRAYNNAFHPPGHCTGACKLGAV